MCCIMLKLYQEVLIMAYANKNEQMEYQNNYNKQKYDSVRVTVPKGKKDEYMKLADKLGLKLNTLINQLLEDKLNKIRIEPE